MGFFDAVGLEEPDVVTDLTADLRTDGLDEQLAGFGPPAGISLAVVTPAQRSMVLDFEDANFPHWSRGFP